MVTELFAPVDVQIELTQSCNWRCRHCYNFWRPQESRFRSLSKDQIEHIVQELKSNQVPSITITGGEPFVCKENLFMLLNIARDAGIVVSLNTNFSLINEEDISVLAKKYRDVSILVSLLSANSVEHEYLSGAPVGTHARLIKHLHGAIQKGLSIGINMVLMRENISSIMTTACLAKELGARAFCATKALPNISSFKGDFLLSSDEVIKSLDDLMNIEKLLKIPVDILGCYPRCLLVGTRAYRRFSHRTCVAGCTTVTIGADGNVRPCSHLEISYGNIFNESLGSIWKNMNGWRKNEFIPKKCLDCFFIDSCRGGCRVNALTPGLDNMDIHANPDKINNGVFEPYPLT